jgi:membrane-associated phospholipid phosphatase
MFIHGNEVIEPEELAQLGKMFDEAWAAVGATAAEGRADQRAILAAILLRLANLRQLGPEQLKATALRIFRSEPIGIFPAVPPVAPSYPSSHTNEAAGCSTSAAPACPPQGA